MNLYKKWFERPYYFLVSDATLASDNSLRFRKNLSKITQKLIITVDDKILDKTLH